MTQFFSFQCSCCGELHEGSPSFGFRAPDVFLQQSQETQEAGFLDSDLCRYEDDDGQHYFIRACLELPIHDTAEPFLWGVWVSLSKQSFDHYIETCDSPDLTKQYFGWFCNTLPYYPDTFLMKTQVCPRDKDLRPTIALENCDHPLANDFHMGISIARAQEIAEFVLHK